MYIYKMKKIRRNQYGIIHLIILVFIVVVAVAVFLWVKHHRNIDSFETCTKSGNPVQLSYPEVCVTKDGKRFIQSIAK